MPSVYNYRHVELDRVGRGKRVIQPPGGQTADIFGSRGGEPSYSSASSQAGSDVASSRVHIETDQQSIASSSNQIPVDGLIRQQQLQAGNGQVSPNGSIGSSSVVSSAAGGQQQQQSVLMADDYKPIPQQLQQQQQYNILQQQQLPRPPAAAMNIHQQQQQAMQQQQQLQQQQDLSRTPKKTIPVLRRNPITGEVYENPSGGQQAPVRVRQPPGGTSSITF